MKLLKYILIFLFIAVILFAAGVWLFMQTAPFGKYPEGKRLARIEQSPNYRDGAFRNLSPTGVQISDKPMARSLYEFFFQKTAHLRPAQPVPHVKTDLHALPRDRDFFVWFGHSSYLLQIGGKRFLVDPVLVSGSPVSFANKMFDGSNPYTPEDIPAADYLVITHDHWDHLDYEAVSRLKDKVGRVITALGVGAHLEHWGYPAEKITELDWYGHAALADGYGITALPARHFSGRSFTRDKTLWASFMVQSPQKSVYIGGDSGYDGFYRDIGRRFPAIDLAILENGQYNEDWAQIHIMPDELVQAAKELNPKQLVTVHNAKFALAKHDWREPLNRIYEHAQRENLPLATPKIGEVFYFSENGQTFGKWWSGLE